MFLTSPATSARTNPQPHPGPIDGLPIQLISETIIAFLMPYFIDAARDKHEARSEIIDTLAAYETRTEMLQAAHIIASA